MIDDPDEVTVVTTPDPVVVEVRMPAEIDVIEVQVPGPQGPPGKDGPPGPPGSGSGGGGREFVQATPAATWIFAHGLGRRPTVSVFDTAGAEMIADVFADASNVSVVFAQPTAGSAVIS